jgi:hypothetical protein
MLSTALSYTPGVSEGNHRRPLLPDPGWKRDASGMAHATPRRSTGIKARQHGPIDARMPVLTPA